MTHTSTKQPELLMKLVDDYAEACFDQGLHQRTTDDKPEAAREKLEKELHRLHARVQELEASKEQRKPLTDEQILDELLGYHGYIHGYMPADCDWLDFARAIEAAHGITQENQHGE